ncbi:hypothetical protein A0H81_01566 [Grifola frondosa]|uniref:Uncharacterized protein n=1 Tax=Grifola frondosa TaxID=5627 RepID=A0A1C7MRC0_GRIFR|nr:hypothetical protein A0H81_01566 [Grifola frondosa]
MYYISTIICFNFSHKRDARQNLKSKKSSRYKANGSKSVRFAEVDLDEDSDIEDAAVSSQSEDEGEGYDDKGEDEEASDANEFIDVLDIMDGRGEPDSGDDRGKVEREKSVPQKEVREAAETLQTVEDEDDEMDGSSGDDEQSESGAKEYDAHEGISASEAEDEENPSALQDLESFVTGLDAGQKRKTPDDDEAAQQGADAVRKEHARLAAKLGEDDENEDDEEGPLRREFESAKERATLRLKNTGDLGDVGPGRKIAEEDKREGESGDEESDDDGVSTIERIKAKGFEELAGLDDGGPAAESGNKHKSIFKMKFMKDAMARNQRVAEEIDDFV